MKRNSVRSMQIFFLVYAGISGAVGLTLTVWPSLVATFDPALASIEHSYVSLLGASLVLAATGSASQCTLHDPKAQRRSRNFVLAGHFFLACVMTASPLGGGNGGKVTSILFGSLVILWIVSEFLKDGESKSGFHSPYEEQIRQAAGQEERNRLARDLHDSMMYNFIS